MASVTANDTGCSDGHWPRYRFRIRDAEVSREVCFWHAISHPRLLRTSIPTALVVGSILTAINQGTVLADGHFPSVLYWKIPLTYSVPFFVSSWGALRVAYVGRGKR